MLKALLNLILSIVLGKLKPVLLKYIEEVNMENITNAEKSSIVLDNFKTDLAKAGKEIGTNILDLLLKAGVAIVKNKFQ